MCGIWEDMIRDGDRRLYEFSRGIALFQTRQWRPRLTRSRWSDQKGRNDGDRHRSRDLTMLGGHHTQPASGLMRQSDTSSCKAS